VRGGGDLVAAGDQRISEGDSCNTGDKAAKQGEGRNGSHGKLQRVRA